MTCPRCGQEFPGSACPRCPRRPSVAGILGIVAAALLGLALLVPIEAALVLALLGYPVLSAALFAAWIRPATRVSPDLFAKIGLGILIAFGAGLGAAAILFGTCMIRIAVAPGLR